MRGVPLAQKAEIEIDREFLATAFSDIVVTNDLLDSIGPAVISQKSIFLHGPSGNGKTTVAERLLRVYTDPIIVPYAVEVDGQIILTYEKGVHEIIDLPEDVDLDPRGAELSGATKARQGVLGRPAGGAAMQVAARWVPVPSYSQ